MMESKTERDERQAKESQEAMPEAQQAMRKNGEMKLKVAIDPQAAVVVKVTQQGQPHPKGLSAEIDHTVGPMTMSGEMVERVKNAAINHVRGQAHEFSISEFDELEVQQKAGNDAGGADQQTAPSGEQSSSTQPPAGDDTPVGATSDAPQGGSGENVAVN